ncbi:DUF3347 domain-containing protein [Flavihumibacter sp. UBA7668]|uniref:DUF3347 domain-containing protein n=1 Tax=Flavihumibacter sp. UBA7668 TaxID=1946542 RepID=UPI0025BBFE30|nr:DUF3347 domain-containing protein [Flavihumibacter sp. UBA7668]
MKSVSLTAFAVILLLVSACNNNTDQQSDKATTTEPPTNQPASSTLEPISTPLTDVYAHYHHISFALAKDDAVEASNGAKALQVAIAEVDKSGMNAEQQQVLAAHEAALQEQAAAIVNAGIDEQRKHYEKLGESLYPLMKAFRSDKPLYKAYCPMAFDNKGASWISTSKEINNPYFGEKMLTCGEIQEEIK